MYFYHDIMCEVVKRVEGYTVLTCTFYDSSFLVVSLLCCVSAVLLCCAVLALSLCWLLQKLTSEFIFLGRRIYSKILLILTIPAESETETFEPFSHRAIN